MRFGVYVNMFYHPGGQPAFKEMAEQARALDQAGFDWVVLGERHVHEPGYHELLTTMAWLAAQTSRIGIATAGFILPIYNPVLLAEATANLDVLSGGRLTLGVVLGYRDEEYRAFQVRPRERVGRFEEVLALVKQLWGGQRVGFKGKYHSLEDVFIRPTPVQRPRPRIWNGGRVPAALDRTARLCDGWTTSFNESPEEMSEKISYYRRLPPSAESLGREVVVLRECFCAPTYEEARRTLEGPLLDLYGAYAGWKKTSIDAYKYARLDMERLAPSIILGSPEQCREQIHRYREMGADGMVFRIQPPGLAHGDAMRCIDLLASEVLPAFRQ